MKRSNKKWISRKLFCLGITCIGINDAAAGGELFDAGQVGRFFQWFVPGNVQREIVSDMENGVMHIADEVVNEERRLVDVAAFLRNRNLGIDVVNGQLVFRPLQPIQENYVVNQITQIFQFIRNRNIHTLCAGGYIFLSIMRDIYNVYEMAHASQAS